MEPDQSYLGGVFSAEKITKYWKNQKPPTNLDEKFKDPFFLPNQNSIQAKDEDGNFIDKIEGAKKSNELDLQNIEWLSAVEIFSEFLIFDDKIEVDDIKQGNIGNCYFLSAIAALCEFPELIFQIFRTKEISKIGYYEIVMFIDGQWQIVVLDDYFPVQAGTTNLKFAKPNGNELWVILLEKAWAKVNGGYANIISGWPCDPLSALTGFATSKLIHSTFSVTSETLWSTLLQAEKNDNLMCTSTKNEKSITEFGLVMNHAYTLIGAKEFKGIRLVHIRNPWGYKEWNGKYSDTSDDWTNELKQAFEYSNSDDGTFFMAFNDFKNFFSRTDVCYITYDSNIKIFNTVFDKDFKDAPLVYNLYIDEDTKVAVSMLRKYWRFNRELRDVCYPISLILCKYSENKVEYIDGEYSAIENVEIVKDLTKGFYAVWFYCPIKRCGDPKPDSLSLRFISSCKFKAKFAAFDTNFDFIKEIMKAAVRLKFSEKVQGKESFNCIENSFKRSGLSFRYVNNKSNSTFHKWINSTHEVQKVFMLPPFESASEFTFYVPPKSENIVLGMRYEQTGGYWFNLKSEVKNIKKEQYDQENKETKTPKINLEQFTNTNIIQLDTDKKYYDYISKSLQASKLELKFNKLNVKEILFQNLIEKYPFEMKILQSFVPYNEENLTWVKIKLENGVYIGQVNKNQKRHGRGAYIWNDKSCYIGYWTEGVKDKYGQFYDSGRTMTYRGDLMKGLRHGNGELFYKNGDNYKGEFKNDIREGKGVYSWADGSKWVGPFMKDDMNGVGMFYSEDGTDEWEVTYKNGQYVE